MLDASRAAGDSPAIGCYTTSRVEAGRVLRVERHCARLRRDASRLGLPAPDPRAIESLLLETARSEFGRGDGIVRVEWSSSDGSDPRLVATTRPIGPEPATWRAGLCSTPHPGPEQRHNTKFIEVEVYEIARREAREQGVQEVLIFDRDGFVVEGGSSNLLVVDEGGRLMTPDPALGSVAGLGLPGSRRSGCAWPSFTPQRSCSPSMPCAASCRSWSSTVSRSATPSPAPGPGGFGPSSSVSSGSATRGVADSTASWHRAQGERS
jgi:hypothetical protein